MGQIKYSFDKTTLKKIGLGFLYGLSTAIIAGGTAYTQGASGKVLVGILITSFTGSVFNTIREYIKGDTKKLS